MHKEKILANEGIVRGTYDVRYILSFQAVENLV